MVVTGRKVQNIRVLSSRFSTRHRFMCRSFFSGFSFCRWRFDVMQCKDTTSILSSGCLLHLFMLYFLLYPSAAVKHVCIALTDITYGKVDFICEDRGGPVADLSLKSKNTHITIWSITLGCFHQFSIMFSPEHTEQWTAPYWIFSVMSLAQHAIHSDLFYFIMFALFLFCLCVCVLLCFFCVSTPPLLCLQLALLVSTHLACFFT